MAGFERGPGNIHFRIWAAFGICLASFSILVARLWFLQVEQGSVFRDRSENNRLRTVYLPAARGLILDRGGEVLVRNRPSFNVELVAEDCPHPKETLEALAQIVGQDPEELKSRLAKEGRRRRFEPKLILRDVSRDTVAQIAAQQYRLPGIVISVVPTRDYPYGELSSHVFGYIREVSGEQLKSPAYSDYLMGDVVGQYGVESEFERYLRGERGTQSIVVNARGNKISEAYRSPDTAGSNITLTIDHRVQIAADTALEGKRGAVVVMDVRSGDILALASAPRFAPAVFTSEIGKGAWSALIDPKENRLSNRAVQGAFAPGSVFKIFVAAAALSEGVVTPKEKISCPGFLKFGQRVFQCHKHSGHGAVNLFEAIVQSCDVYFYTVGQRLGVDRINHYAQELFALGELTEVAGKDESKGVIPSTKWKETYFKRPEDKKWYPGETLSVAIGQGAVTTTPVQVARSLAAVVNGGRVLKPRLVKRVVAADGRVLLEAPAEPDVLRTVELEPDVVSQLKAAMEGVVSDKRGTGHRAALPEKFHIGVGGKTGTAQVASRESGVKEEDHAWFAGYAPADNPQVVAVALIENGGHGGVSAAPAVRKVLAAYFGVPEEVEPEPKQEPKKQKPKVTVAGRPRATGEG